MKKSRYIDSQILNNLRLNESGASVPDLYREYGMSIMPPFTNGVQNTVVCMAAYVTGTTCHKNRFVQHRDPL
ncbi:hypothetical protein JYT31_00495 [Beggiatoa alba]|nr:hypothetical protein [Beggiatoa alba]